MNAVRHGVAAFIVVLSVMAKTSEIALAADAPRVLATTVGLTRAATYGTTLAYSNLDVHTGRYRLVAGTLGGSLKILPIPSRGVPFDVDLGPGAHGERVAVYSRCNSEQNAGDVFKEDGQLEFTRGTGCKLYRYVFAEHREKVLKRVSGRPGSESLPTLWRHRIAYASSGSSAQPRLYLASINGRTRRQLPGGTAGAAAPTVLPLALDLYGRRLAFTWLSSPDNCTGATNNPEERLQPTYTSLSVTTPGAAARLITRACNEVAERSAIVGASWVDGNAAASAVGSIPPEDKGDNYAYSFMLFGFPLGGNPISLGGTTDAKYYVQSASVIGHTIVAAVLVFEPGPARTGKSQIIAIPRSGS